MHTSAAGGLAAGQERHHERVVCTDSAGFVSHARATGCRLILVTVEPTAIWRTRFQDASVACRMWHRGLQGIRESERMGIDSLRRRLGGKSGLVGRETHGAGWGVEWRGRRLDLPCGARGSGCEQRRPARACVSGESCAQTDSRLVELMSTMEQVGRCSVGSSAPLRGVAGRPAQRPGPTRADQDGPGLEGSSSGRSRLAWRCPLSAADRRGGRA